MKKNFILFFAVTLMAGVLLSCKKDEVFAPNTKTAGTIQFQVADGVLTGTIYYDAVAKLPVTQPSWDVAAGRFSKATVASPNYVNGNVEITVNVSSNISNVTVNLLNTSTGVRELRGTFTGVSGSVKFTAPIVAVPAAVPPVLGIGAGGTTPANNATLILEFIGSDSSGKVIVTRVFSATVIA